MQNDRCTFWNGYGNFNRFWFSSRIHSTQIQLCCFTGKLKSTVIPLCGTDRSLFAWHNVSYVLTVGTKLFGCLAGRKVEIFFLDWPSSFDQKIYGIMQYQDRCWETCLICVPSTSSVCSCDHLNPLSTNEGIQKELKEEDGCQLFNFTPLLTFQNFFFVQDKWMNSCPDCGAELNTSIQPVLLGIYWKEQEMEEKAIDWKMSESDCVIVNWSTALQGDSRLAAAPFAPGALLVSDSDLDEILCTVQQTALVYEFSRFNLLMQDLVPYVPNTLFTYMNKACFWQQHHNWLIGFQLILEWTVLTGLCIHWLLSAVLTRTSRFMG